MANSSGRPQIVCWGASSRWIAETLCQDFDVIAVDLFGDVDTRRCSHQTYRVERLSDILGLLPSLNTAKLILPGGGTENISQGWRRLHENFDVAMVSERAREAARDPHDLAKLFREHFPATFSSRLGVVPEFRWLLKPILGAGGTAVRIWDRGSAGEIPPGFMLQRFVDGDSYSAIFFSRHDGDRESAVQSKTEWIGVTRQWVCGASGPRPFAYAGSIGPVKLPEDVGQRLHRLATSFANKFAVKGVWGIDFLIPRDHEELAPPMVVDVNLRPTASLEILPRDVARQFLLEHIACFSENFNDALPRVGATISSGSGSKQRGDKFSAKLIVYHIGKPAIWQSKLLSEFEFPRDAIRVADIPENGTELQHGHPVCTLLGSGEDIGSLERILVSTRERLRLRIQQS